MTVGEGQDLAVQDAVPVQRAGGLDDFRELAADVVQVPAVQPDLGPAPVELGSHTVVLVLDPDGGPEPRQYVGGILGGRGQHELDRMEQPEPGLVQATLFGEDGRLARVAGQHQRHAHGRLGPLEGLRDGSLQQPLAQPDAEFASQDLDDVLGGQGITAIEQTREQRALLGRGSRALDRAEGIRDLAEARGETRVRSHGPKNKDIGHGLSEIGGSIVGLAEGSRGHPRQAADDRGDRRPAQSDCPLIRFREGPAGQERGGHAKLRGRQGRQVSSEQRGLLRGSSGPADAFGQLAPATHGGDGIPSLSQTRSTGIERSTVANRRMRWHLRLVENRGVPRSSRVGRSFSAGTGRRTCARSCAGTRTPKSRA